VTDDAPTGDLAGRLRASRRRRIVGRTAELELFRQAVAAGPGAFSVLYLHGPGGVGKSTLLTAMAEAAAGLGAAPVRVDARLTDPTPAALLTAVGSGGPARVVLLDTYELLAPLDDWLRDELLPGLPENTIVVIAGRLPPSARWLTDPAWRDLLRVVALRNLAPDDARRYLALEEVPAPWHERLLRLSHGHPLTLSLLADHVRRTGADERSLPRSLSDVPDLLGVLVRDLVDAAPGARHRRALAVCAHARFTTEDLLRAVLGEPDSADLFAWLRGLSFVTEEAFGLHPHDLTRDVLDGDLMWRDREGYADLHRRVRTELIERVRRATPGPERQRLVADALFVVRQHPPMARYLQAAPGNENAVRIDEVRDDDRAAILAMTERHEGHAQAELVAYWLGRRPREFRVFRGAHGRVQGFAARLAIGEATEADLAADPGVRAMHAYAHRRRPPRPGESMSAWRFFLDADHHHAPSSSLTLVAAWNLEEILTQRHCSWDFVATYQDPEIWTPVMAYIDFARTPEADYDVGGRRYVVFAHDWRQVDVPRWLELTARQELGSPAPERTESSPLLVLSQAEFAEAVRTALRDLHRPDLLQRNPLMRARLVRGPAGADPTAGALRERLLDAAAAVRADPRRDPLHQVLHRTFLQPAPTQERAAEALHLSFSTYRRRRDRAVKMVIDWLWDRELYG